MSTIKVLHVIARMNVGGTARYVGDLVENIPNSALATGYVQGSEIEDPIVNTINPYRIPHMGRKISAVNDFRAWLELRKLIHELQPEIVHTHTFKAGLIGRLVGGNQKRVHTFHGHLYGDQSFSSFEKKIISAIEKFLAKRTDLLISVGVKVGLELRAQGIGTNRNWTSIAPGVNPLPAIDKAQARDLLGIDRDEIIFGWMARMAAVKNPHLLLAVAKRLPLAHFVMAGGGDLLEEISSAAPTNVSVIGWADGATFWSAVDCAISTSDNEGMPIALIEAQLAGIPVIATDVGSNSEVISHESTGLLTHGDIISVTKALERLIDSSELRTAMGREAKIWAAETFSRDKMLEKHGQIYEKLAHN